MNAVDTNVLLYVLDTAEPAKQRIASQLVNSLQDVALVWQVAAEYLAASRKFERHGCTWAVAWSELARLRRVWSVVQPNWNTFTRAERLIRSYSLSFWDALLIAACLDAGVTRLYSEDLTAYPRIDTLEFVNPFAA